MFKKVKFQDRGKLHFLFIVKIQENIKKQLNYKLFLIRVWVNISFKNSQIDFAIKNNSNLKQTIDDLRIAPISKIMALLGDVAGMK